MKNERETKEEKPEAKTEQAQHISTTSLQNTKLWDDVQL
jgi:hypothetical protein